MSKIKKIHARQIIDSRGKPTVEAIVTTSSGSISSASVPSGASTGKYEAVELRDNDKNLYLGSSVFKAVNNIKTILNNELAELSVYDQNLIDQKMIDLDGTNNKSNLGANSILAVSLAVAKAAAQDSGKYLFNYLAIENANELPVPMMTARLRREPLLIIRSYLSMTTENPLGQKQFQLPQTTLLRRLRPFRLKITAL